MSFGSPDYVTARNRRATGTVVCALPQSTTEAANCAELCR
jgi:hypothetical protein